MPRCAGCWRPSSSSASSTPRNACRGRGLSAAIIDCDAHRAIARQAAVESIVLLKNNGVLPLRRDHESILVTGPTAANTQRLLGDYFGVSSRLVTLLEGITEFAAEGCRVVYRTGLPPAGRAGPRGQLHLPHRRRVRDHDRRARP